MHGVNEGQTRERERFGGVIDSKFRALARNVFELFPRTASDLLASVARARFDFHVAPVYSTSSDNPFGESKHARSRTFGGARRLVGPEFTRAIRASNRVPYRPRRPRRLLMGVALLVHA